MNSLQTIIAMLGYKRPAGSKTERAFIRDWIRPLGVEQDKAGNLYKRIGDSPVIWSCHTDTVHKNGGPQLVTLKDGYAEAPRSDCLGADDTAGVWLMREMILAQRPGLYLFHRAEEIGGIGSQHIATKTPELLAQSSIAIAFDRRGTSSIITHQWGGRCCSDAFAYSLGNALGMGHTRDDGGSFTDTANYTELVAECTNLSAGYYNEHRANESLDTSYLIELRERLLALDSRDLIVERDPKDVDFDYLDQVSSVTVRFSDTYHQNHNDNPPDVDDVPRGYGSLYAMIRDNPKEVADMMESFGVDAQTLASEILIRGGIVPRRHLS